MSARESGLGVALSRDGAGGCVSGFRLDDDAGLRHVLVRTG